MWRRGRRGGWLVSCDGGGRRVYEVCSVACLYIFLRRDCLHVLRDNRLHHLPSPTIPHLASNQHPNQTTTHNHHPLPFHPNVLHHLPNPLHNPRNPLNPPPHPRTHHTLTISTPQKTRHHRRPRRRPRWRTHPHLAPPPLQHAGDLPAHAGAHAARGRRRRRRVSLRAESGTGTECREVVCKGAGEVAGGCGRGRGRGAGGVCA